MINIFYKYFIMLFYGFLILLLYYSISAIEISHNKKILLNSYQTFTINNNTCIEIIIPNNYKKLNLTLDSTHISNIVITDIPIIQCSSNQLANCCSDNSTFCMENINPIHNFFNLYYCLDKTYIYACSSNEGNSLLTITTNVINDEGCQIAEFAEETECAKIGLTNCKDQNKCNPNCKYVDCLSNTEEKIFSMCLPLSYTMTEIVSRCENHILFNSDGSGGKVSIRKCENEEEIKKNSSFSHKLFKSIAVLFGTFLLCLLMSSVYYRFKTSMNANTPPFTPPWYCPNFIFPRVNPNLLS